MIYLDNAATTFPKPESVYQAMDRANREMGVNAGRGSYKKAREASAVISETKGLLRRLVKADNNAAVVFTPSITIALNEIINGLSFMANDVIYASPYEHNAVARVLHQVSKQKRIKIKILPLDEKTLEIDCDKVIYEFSKEKPKAVFCTHISNVTGYILPIEQIFAEAKKYDAVTVLDSAQSLGLVEVDSRKIGADIIAFAGHKSLYGPFGIGGFINIHNIELNTFIVGGTGSDSLNLEMPSGSEAKYESSSTNIVAVSGLHAALKALDQGMIWKHEKELTEYLLSQLTMGDKIKVYVPKDLKQHIGIVSLSVNSYKADEVGEILDVDYDIAVRTGYHCAPFIHKFLNDNNLNGTVRVSLSQFSTKQDIDIFISALNEII